MNIKAILIQPQDVESTMVQYQLIVVCPVGIKLAIQNYSRGNSEAYTV